MPVSSLARKSRAAAAWRVNPYQPALARIVRIERLGEAEQLFTIRFVDPSLADGFTHRAGQFVMLSVFGAGEMPVSIASPPSRGGVLELCVRRVGAGRVTNALFRLQANDLVGVRGPYGNGFPVEAMRGQSLLLVAGGLGIAPLRSLLWSALDARDRFARIVLMYGARTPPGMLFRDELVSLLGRSDVECLLTVDDAGATGWPGHVGRVPELFDHVTLDAASTYAALCGPPVLFRHVVDRLLQLAFSKDRILMSLERRMECGVGTCGHCSVGYKYTCIHGPIFTYWDAINLPEMI